MSNIDGNKPLGKKERAVLGPAKNDRAEQVPEGTTSRLERGVEETFDLKPLLDKEVSKESAQEDIPEKIEKCIQAQRRPLQPKIREVLQKNPELIDILMGPLQEHCEALLKNRSVLKILAVFVQYPTLPEALLSEFSDKLDTIFLISPGAPEDHLKRLGTYVQLLQITSTPRLLKTEIFRSHSSLGIIQALQAVPEAAEKLIELSPFALQMLFNYKNPGQAIKLLMEHPSYWALLEKPVLDPGAIQINLDKLVAGKEIDLEPPEILLHKAGTTYQLQKEIGAKYPWQGWNTAWVIEIAERLVTTEGFVDLEALEAFEEELQENPIYKQREFGAQRELIAILLKAIKENKNGLREALEQIPAPMGQRVRDKNGNMRYKSQMGRVIRTALQLPKGHAITEREAKVAFLSALLSRIRQCDLGSCFSTAITLLLQQKYTEKIVAQLGQLIQTDCLQGFEGKNTVPINTDVSEEGSSTFTIKIEEAGQFITLSNGSKTTLDALPSLRAGLIAAGIAGDSHKALLADYSLSQKNQSVKIDQILRDLIEMQFPGKSNAAKRRRYEKAKQGFNGTINHPLMRVLEYTLANFASAPLVYEEAFHTNTDPIFSQYFAPESPSKEAALQAVLPQLADFLIDFEGIPDFPNHLKQTLQEASLFAFYDVSRDYHFAAYQYLDGKVEKLDELTAFNIVEDFLYRALFSIENLDLNSPAVQRLLRKLETISNTENPFQAIVEKISFEDYKGGFSDSILKYAFGVEISSHTKDSFTSLMDYTDRAGPLRFVVQCATSLRAFKMSHSDEEEFPGILYQSIGHAFTSGLPAEAFLKQAAALDNPEHYLVATFQEPMEALASRTSEIDKHVLLEGLDMSLRESPPIDNEDSYLAVYEKIRDAWMKKNIHTRPELIEAQLAKLNLKFIKAFDTEIPLGAFADLNYDENGQNVYAALLYNPFEKRWEIAKAAYDGTKLELLRIAPRSTAPEDRDGSLYYLFPPDLIVL